MFYFGIFKAYRTQFIILYLRVQTKIQQINHSFSFLHLIKILKHIELISSTLLYQRLKNRSLSMRLIIYKNSKISKLEQSKSIQYRCQLLVAENSRDILINLTANYDTSQTYQIIQQIGKKRNWQK